MGQNLAATSTQSVAIRCLHLKSPVIVCPCPCPLHELTQLLEAQVERGTAALPGPLVLLTSADKEEVDGVLRDELGGRVGRVSVCSHDVASFF
jgi:hypothetical protein